MSLSKIRDSVSSFVLHVVVFSIFVYRFICYYRWLNSQLINMLSFLWTSFIFWIHRFDTSVYFTCFDVFFMAWLCIFAFCMIVASVWVLHQKTFPPLVASSTLPLPSTPCCWLAWKCITGATPAYHQMKFGHFRFYDLQNLFSQNPALFVQSCRFHQYSIQISPNWFSGWFVQTFDSR